MKLTLETARALLPGQTLKDHDPRTKGLQLRARGTVKSWHYYYRGADGTQRRPKFGEFPQLSIDAARRVAAEWAQRVAKGEDPSAERQSARAAPTIDKLCDHYLKEYAAKVYAPTTLDHATWAVELYIRPELGRLKVATVAVADVNRLIDRIAAGKVMLPKKKGGQTEWRACAPSVVNANHVRGYLSKAMALAEGDSLKWRPRGSNPCKDEETKSFPTRSRRVHIRSDEFAAVNRSLMTLAETYPWHVAAIFVALFSGSRVTETARFRGSDIETDPETGAVNAVLRQHKTVRHVGERRVMLPRPAVAIIARLEQHKSGYVFGPVGELAKPRKALWEIWDKARKISGVRAEIQARDLRRTFASVARTAGATLQDIQPLLGHTNTGTTKGYAYLFEDKQRDLTEDTAERISALLEGPKREGG